MDRESTYMRTVECLELDEMWKRGRQVKERWIYVNEEVQTETLERLQASSQDSSGERDGGVGGDGRAWVGYCGREEALMSCIMNDPRVRLASGDLNNRFSTLFTTPTMPVPLKK